MMRTWVLVVLFGCDNPAELALAEQSVASGLLTAGSCSIQLGDGTCRTEIGWSSTGVTEQFVQVRARGDVIACGASNAEGTAISPQIIPAGGVRLELRAAQTCDPLGVLGPLLAEVVARGRFTQPTCGTTPMGKVEQDFAGIIGFAAHDGLGTVANIARQVREAKLSYVRVFASWSMIELASGSLFDWTDRDLIINAFLDAGNTVILTLGYPPRWRSTAPPTNDDPTKYFPNDLARWDGYVLAVIARYGARVDHWQIWNEPNLRTEFRTFDDGEYRYVRYVQLLNRTAALIRAHDPGATIWAPDIVAGGFEDEDFAVETLTRGIFDRFTIHTFKPTIGEMVQDLDRFEALAGPLIQVSVTAAQLIPPLPLPPAPELPRRRDTCPFVGMPEIEHARAIQDIYACLGNAGARNVFLYKTHDRILEHCRTLNNGAAPPPPDVDNPDGYELSGILGPHPLGSFAEAIGQCVDSDCSMIEHRKKPAFWAVRAVTAHTTAP